MPIDTTYLDADSDNVLLARPALLATAQGVNALQAAGASALIPHTPAGAGAVATDVHDVLDEVVRPEGFGAVLGAAAGVNLAAFKKACIRCWQTGKTLKIGPGDWGDARVELHGSFNVIGGGATVAYLGVGTTYIAGVGAGTAAAPTAWPIDASYDPEGNFTPRMYSIAANINAGDSFFLVNDPTGLVVGQILFIGGNPTSASSTTNYIPSDFEFVRVKSLDVGGRVNISGRIKNAYPTVGTGAGAAAAYYSPGLAQNCRVSGLKISTVTDAYQFVVRSAYNVTLEDLEFTGEASCGAATFSENLHINQWKVHYANGPVSTARGTVSAVIENVEYMQNTGGPTGLFIEESFYRIVVRNFNARNSAFSIRSLDLPESAQKRSITIEDSIFDARSQATSPMQCGTASGIDLHALRSVFAGTVVTPDAGQYPSVNGQALTWVSGSLASDTWRFTDCKFISTNSGATWPLTAAGAFNGIGGFLGNVEFNSGCTFDVCSNAHFRPWVATLIGSTAAPAVPVVVTGYLTKEGKNIRAWCDFQNKDTTGATGVVRVTGLPSVAANNGMNYVGSSMTANLGGVPTAAFIEPNSAVIKIFNGATYGELAMLAGAGKFLTCGIQYVAA